MYSIETKYNSLKAISLIQSFFFVFSLLSLPVFSFFALPCFCKAKTEPCFWLKAKTEPCFCIAKTDVFSFFAMQKRLHTSVEFVFALQKQHNAKTTQSKNRALSPCFCTAKTEPKGSWEDGIKQQRAKKV